MALKVKLNGILFEEDVAPPPPKPKAPIDCIVKSVNVESMMLPQSVKTIFRFEVQLYENIDITLLGGAHAIVEHHCEVVQPDGTTLKASQGRITMQEDGISLIDTEADTIYKVTLMAMMPYTNYLKQSVSYGPLPISNQISFSARIPSGSDPAQCTISEALSVSHTNNSELKSTDVKATLLPVKQFSVKWTFPRKLSVAEKKSAPVISAPSKPQPEKELVVTSGQDYLHTIGGGMCATTLYQHYTVLNGSISSVSLELDNSHGSIPRDTEDRMENSPRMKIISVTGKYLRHWDYSKSLLKMEMEQAVQGVLHFTIQIELELVGSSCLMCPPKLKPLATSRNKGNIAIQACPGIEVRDTDCVRATKVDEDELPSVYEQHDDILHSFKFLSSGNHLTLEVIKHHDVSVLVASVERARYTITHTGEFLFYHLAYEIRNSECQFLRLDIPPKAKIWSAVVAGDPVKPSMDEESILLPLIKFNEEVFVVELMFAIRSSLPTSMFEEKFSLLIPKIDIPISKLFIKLFAPSTNVYSQWGGDLDECDSDDEFDIRHITNAEKKLKLRLEKQNRTEQEWMYCLQDEVADEEEEEEEHNDRNAGGVALGLKPLKLGTQVFRTGRCFSLVKYVVPARTSLTISCLTCKGEESTLRTLSGEKSLRRQQQQNDAGCCSLM